MFNFRQKRFSTSTIMGKDIKNKGKKALEYLKAKAGINPFTVGTFMLSGANLATNLSRKRSDTRYQEDQLGAMKDLTHALTGVDKTIKEASHPVTPSKKPKDSIFRGLFSKNFSIESKNLKSESILKNIR